MYISVFAHQMTSGYKIEHLFELELVLRFHFVFTLSSCVVAAINVRVSVVANGMLFLQQLKHEFSRHNCPLGRFYR